MCLRTVHERGTTLRFDRLGSVLECVVYDQAHRVATYYGSDGARLTPEGKLLPHTPKSSSLLRETGRH